MDHLCTWNITPTVTPIVTATPAPGTFPLLLTGIGTMEKNLTLPVSRWLVVNMNCAGTISFRFADITRKDLCQILTRSTIPTIRANFYPRSMLGIYP
jgi:hypothetical protein